MDDVATTNSEAVFYALLYFFLSQPHYLILVIYVI